MKLRIEASCREEDLLGAIFEAKTIMKSIDLVQLEIKVRHPLPSKGEQEHSWISLTNESYPPEVLEIYNLKKQVKTLTP